MGAETTAPHAINEYMIAHGVIAEQAKPFRMVVSVKMNRVDHLRPYLVDDATSWAIDDPISTGWNRRLLTV